MSEARTCQIWVREGGLKGLEGRRQCGKAAVSLYFRKILICKDCEKGLRGEGGGIGIVALKTAEERA
jgi:hypothetical protein